MRMNVLKDMRNLTYYNTGPVKLTPNAPKNAKKCELVDFNLEIAWIKILKNLEYITQSLKLSNITQTRASIIHVPLVQTRGGSSTI